MKTAADLKPDPKLTRIASALRGAFGARLVSALLFGSRARGDHRDDSDYDVAVLLEGYDHAVDRPILDRVREELGEDVFTLQFWPFGRDGLAERTTLTFNIRNDAVPLPGFGWPEVVAPSIAPDGGLMKPETKALLDGSDRELAKVKKMLSVDEPEEAARLAYQAALFAARALIFEYRSIAPKTHSGTDSLFSEIAIKDGLLGSKHTGTLTQGLDIRTEVDYQPAPKVTAAQAHAYIDRATELVHAVRQVLERGN